MILSKGKRKIVYNGITYYWYVKNPYIYIIREDKEIGIGTHYIENLLFDYYN